MFAHKLRVIQKL